MVSSIILLYARRFAAAPTILLAMYASRERLLPRKLPQREGWTNADRDVTLAIGARDAFVSINAISGCLKGVQRRWRIDNGVFARLSMCDRISKPTRT